MMVMFIISWEDQSASNKPPKTEEKKSLTLKNSDQTPLKENNHEHQ